MTTTPKQYRVKLRALWGTVADSSCVRKASFGPPLWRRRDLGYILSLTLRLLSPRVHLHLPLFALASSRLC